MNGLIRPTRRARSGSITNRNAVTTWPAKLIANMHGARVVLEQLLSAVVAPLPLDREAVCEVGGDVDLAERAGHEPDRVEHGAEDDQVT